MNYVAIVLVGGQIDSVSRSFPSRDAAEQEGEMLRRNRVAQDPPETFDPQSIRFVTVTVIEQDNTFRLCPRCSGWGMPNGCTRCGVPCMGG